MADLPSQDAAAPSSLAVDPPPRSSRPTSTSAIIARLFSTHSNFLVILLLLALNNLALRLLNLPLNRVIELRYCNDYYRKHDPFVIEPGGQIDEGLCKIDPVQQKLAWLEAFIGTSITICDLVVTVPYGAISDRLGRRLVLCLNVLASAVLFAWIVLVGKIHTIPVEAMIAAPFLALFGGGECVFVSTVFALLADSSQDTGTRTTYFAYVGSLSYVFSLLGPVLSAAVMTLNLWTPFYLGIGLLVASLPVCALLPQSRSSASTPPPYRVDADEETSLLHGTNDGNAPIDTLGAKPRFHTRILAHGKDTVQFLVGKPRFNYLLGIIFVLAIASSSTDILTLYLSKRYHKAFAQVGYLLSLKAGVNILLLTIILPSCLKFLTLAKSSQVAADFIAAEASFWICCVGSLVLALAGNLWLAITALAIYGLGTGTFVLLLSLVKSSVANPEGESDNGSGKDYGIVVIVRTIGSLLGTPIMTAMWITDLDLSGGTFGLPFLTSAALYVVCWGLLRHLHKQWAKLS
ncbi:major facilitator superfamily domain-containing protein [Nemania sp. FL0031]|nr:major facilitator superfamily domain-containing protein [Nemania sp. FL0031]